MNGIHAPAQLPFAPRPIATELLSSWLLRVAAANLISLPELVGGLESRYGPVLANTPIDYGLPEVAIRALSRFCRVAPKTIRRLDLRQRVTGLTPAQFLGFRPIGVPGPRYSSHRIGYAFCSSCITEQRVIHVPWEWSLACLSRCMIHRRPLLEGCPACGESDPLTFSAPDSPCRALCRWCGVCLASGRKDARVDTIGESKLQAVEDDYRAALAGAAPLLLPKTTAGAFRLFFEEMLQLLTRSLNGGLGQKRGAGLFSRQELLTMIAALVLDAAPNPDSSVRTRRGARSLRLWGSLVSVIPEYEGDAIERTSILWPGALRRRFLAGLSHRTRKRWPNTPYRSASYSGTAVQRVEVASISSLDAMLRSAEAANRCGIWLQLAPSALPAT